MQACAYCNKTNVKITKEHLFPASLHRRIDEANREFFKQANLFYLSIADKFVVAEPQVKDVCAECNNGVLSKLDAYICELWDKYFHVIVEHGAEIQFEYNYDLLSRWLLKMCYNSSRIHNSDVKHLEKCRDYILGKASHPDHVTIHLQLVYPVEFTQSDFQTAREFGLELSRHEPRLNRVGHLGYMTRTGIGRMVRAVHLQSYLFIIHLFPDKATTNERESNLEDFAIKLPFAKKLDATVSSCLLKCEGMGSKELLYSHYRRKGIPKF
jgi:hypothetical protein